ncbi:murein biosynthesis integral membrane protein MurJ [Georgenia sp. Z1344]|uniref:murein biosynthesis integral membrane protein MurJ n=1 Tax=Georgenia sp. Z1344 TaxID=3416706 RepID=UPI003CEFF0E9
MGTEDPPGGPRTGRAPADDGSTSGTGSGHPPTTDVAPEGASRRTTAGSPVLAGALGAAGLIAVLTLASRAAGFARWLVQSWVLGSSATADAYAKANTVPNVLFEIAAGGALVGLVVPLLAAPLAQGLRDETGRRASALLSWTIAILAPVGLLVAVLARPLAGLLLGSDAPAESLDLTATFLRIFAVQVPLYGVGTVLTGVAQAHHRFAWPALAPLLSSLVVIATYGAVGLLGGPATDDPATIAPTMVAILGWGTTAGVLAMSLAPALALRGLGLRWRPTLALGADLRRRALALAGAGLTALLAQQVAVLAVLRATSAVPGSYNVWQYAQAAYLLPYAVLAVPLVTAMAPRIAELAADSVARAAPVVARSARAVVAAGALGAGALVAVAPAVTAVFSARFDMPGMTPTLTVLALGLPGFALLLHAQRSLYAVHRARLATIPALVGWLVTALATVVAGLAAAGASSGTLLSLLAAASSAGMTLAGVLAAICLARALGGPALSGLVRTAATAVLGAALAGLAGRWVTDLALGDGLLRAVLAVLAGGLVALALWVGVMLVADRQALQLLRRRGRGTGGDATTSHDDETRDDEPRTSATDDEADRPADPGKGHA